MQPVRLELFPSPLSIKSILIPIGYKVKGWEGANFTGRSVEFTRSQQDLTTVTTGLTAKENWSNRIVSIEVIDLNAPPTPSPPPAPIQPRAAPPPIAPPPPRVDTLDDLLNRSPYVMGQTFTAAQYVPFSFSSAVSPRSGARARAFHQSW